MEIIKGQTYTYDWTETGDSIIINTPWKDETNTITNVEIVDEIKPTSTACWFANCSQLTEIKNIENMKTQNVTNMQAMFAYCTNLTNLDLNTFNTRNVTDMESMFVGCSSLTNLNVSSFILAR